MFKSIEALRGQVNSVFASITFLPDGQLSVIVNPDPDGDAVQKNPALGTQFQVQGTPEDLDQHFASAIGTFANVRMSIADQTEANTKAIEDANKAKAKPTLKADTKVSSVDTTALSGEVATGTAGLESCFDPE